MVKDYYWLKSLSQADDNDLYRRTGAGISFCVAQETNKKKEIAFFEEG